jgi:hypothetical protein
MDKGCRKVALVFVYCSYFILSCGRKEASDTLSSYCSYCMTNPGTQAQASRVLGQVSSSRVILVLTRTGAGVRLCLSGPEASASSRQANW